MLTSHAKKYTVTEHKNISRKSDKIFFFFSFLSKKDVDFCFSDSVVDFDEKIQIE